MDLALPLTADPTTTTVTDVTITEPDLDETAAPADPVRAYLDAIGRTPLLTAAEEVEIAQRIEAGVYAAELLRRIAAGEGGPVPHDPADLALVAEDGAAAKLHMMNANLRLVVSIAKKHAHRGLGLLDVVQEGNLGLIRAVEKFDYAKGYKFSTYATWWIRQAIGRGMAEQSRVVRLPVHVLDELSKVTRTQRELVAAARPRRHRRGDRGDDRAVPRPGRRPAPGQPGTGVVGRPRRRRRRQRPGRPGPGRDGAGRLRDRRAPGSSPASSTGCWTPCPSGRR